MTQPFDTVSANGPSPVSAPLPSGVPMIFTAMAVIALAVLFVGLLAAADIVTAPARRLRRQ